MRTRTKEPDAPAITKLPEEERRFVGMFMHYALGHLWRQSIDAQPAGGDADDFRGCCPECCAPCWALSRLRDLDLLDEWARSWPEECTPNTSYWHPDFELIDRAWLNRAWMDADKLGCHGN